MKKIVILGGGKSATVLIHYLLEKAGTYDWQIIVADNQPGIVAEKLGTHERLSVKKFEINDTGMLGVLTEQADIVVSMLPARFHPIVGAECVRRERNMVTASYVSHEMKVIHGEALRKGLLFLNEMGVDPGIDHMSAMQVIDDIRSKGGEITAFESFTGGLLSPESETDNPWRYKFTWNPRNVVLAGQGTVKFIQKHRYKYIPYHKLFRRTEIIDIPGYGLFEGYANRDSLSYREAYGLENVATMYRGTLRRPGFCRTWDAFVQLGATDDSYVMQDSEKLTKRQFMNSFLSYNPNDSVELKLAHYMGWDLDSEEMHRMKWLGIFEEEGIGLKEATPAQLLQRMLRDKWTLEPEDRDMIVMWHKFNFMLDGRPREIHSSMVVAGDDQVHTAMAKTVGLPVGIAVRLVLEGAIPLTGVHVPVVKEIYEPVLKELKEHGVVFREREVPPSDY